MATPLYLTFDKLIGDATDRLLRHQVDPWIFLTTGHPLKLSLFDGREIHYQGVSFEGSPRNVFWSRYINPFLEELTVAQLAAASAAARERGVDGPSLLKEVQGLLVAASKKVFERMAEVDQRLRGNGYPQSVPRRSVVQEQELLRQFIELHTGSELEMWNQERWYEIWYEKNKFWVWLFGIVVAIAGVASKFV